MSGYSWTAGDGHTVNMGIDFTVKAGEAGATNGAAVMEYVTRRGEEPPDHVHPTEDEMFYVLDGSLTFRCGGDEHRVGAGGFVFLPAGVEHGYLIEADGEVRLLVITAPPRVDPSGWGGFVADLQGADRDSGGAAL